MSRVKKEVKITYATVDTPAQSLTGATPKEKLHLSPAEFGAQLKAHSANIKRLVKMGRDLGKAKGGKATLADGTVFGAKELNKLVTQETKTLGQLKKNYTARGSKKKRPALTKEGKERKTGDGFGKGSFLEAPLIQFLREANFGAQNAVIHAAIDPLLDQGVLSRAILTPLMTAYMFANGLRFVEDGKKYYRTDDVLNRVLGPYISAEEASDTGLSKSGKPRMKFARNKFVYNRLQSIVNPGIKSKDSLSADEVAYVSNPAIVSALAEAQKVATAANTAATV